MSTRNTWIAVDHRSPVWIGLWLVVALTACVAPTSVVDSESASDALDGSSTLEKNPTDRIKDGLCDRPEPNLTSLSAPDNTPIFEQFNFQPQDIAIASDGVEINATYHTFAYCKDTNEWAIANRTAPEKLSFNYEQYLQDLANPDYETLQIQDQDYAYRVRLQAPWIEEQIDEQNNAANTSSTATTTETSSEETVYFELKAPDGNVTTHLLYTLTEVQNASLGASLGVPSIAGVVKTEDAIWFAATTSQGEGENGFASLLRYDLESSDVEIHRPPEIQGDQITSLTLTPSPPKPESKQTDSQPTENEVTDGQPTLWMGTLRSAEGNPFFPASGLVAYQPTSDDGGTLRQYTITNSPIVGAIPYQLAATEDELWIATGNGICQTQWLTIDTNDSWRCWRFTATATVPSEGVDLYPSFLSEEPATQIKDSDVEVLWADWEHFDQPDVNKAGAFRYEVAYEPGFEADLAQGGYRVDSEVAQRMARGNDVFWPGQSWHWSGRRFERSLDEVALNLVGGGPYGLIASNIRTGFSFDHYAIRGEFDLLSLKPDGTRVRYYSGWVEGSDLEVYPKIVKVEELKETEPDPIAKIATDLPPVGP